jgi:hypothetical protein
MNPLLTSFRTIAIAIFLSNVAAAQDSLIAKGYLNNKLHISVPSTFEELSAETIANRFPDPKSRPSIVLADKEDVTSLKIVEMPQMVSDNEVSQYKQFYMSHMKKQPNLQWLGDGLRKINGKNFGYIKVVYTDKGTFAYFLFTSFNGRLLLLTYNCADKLWANLENTFEQIAKSIKIE